MKKVVSTKKAPEAIGPYSQCIVSSSLAFLSGQIGLDPATGQVVNGGIETETKQVMKNIEAILHELGKTFEDIVKTTIFLVDLNHFSTVNQIYGSNFPKNPPARSTVEVTKLPRNALVEIECIVGL